MYGEDAAYALAVATPFALAIAGYDLRRAIVPNGLTLATGAVFLAFCFLMLPLNEAAMRLAGGALVLVICFALFSLGWLGGGDAKAAAAFAPMVAPQDAAPALLILAICGVVGLVLFLLIRRTALTGAAWKDGTTRGAFPYAVALSAALLIYLALAAFFV